MRIPELQEVLITEDHVEQSSGSDVSWQDRLLSGIFALKICHWYDWAHYGGELMKLQLFDDEEANERCCSGSDIEVRHPYQYCRPKVQYGLYSTLVECFIVLLVIFKLSFLNM